MSTDYPLQTTDYKVLTTYFSLKFCQQTGCTTAVWGPKAASSRQLLQHDAVYPKHMHIHSALWRYLCEPHDASGDGPPANGPM